MSAAQASGFSCRRLLLPWRRASDGDDGCMTRAKARRRVERLISAPVRTQGDFLMTTAPDHIVVVNLENESFDDVVGNAA